MDPAPSSSSRGTRRSHRKRCRSTRRGRRTTTSRLRPRAPPPHGATPRELADVERVTPQQERSSPRTACRPRFPRESPPRRRLWAGRNRGTHGEPPGNRIGAPDRRPGAASGRPHFTTCPAGIASYRRPYPPPRARRKRARPGRASSSLGSGSGGSFPPPSTQLVPGSKRRSREDHPPAGDDPVIPHATRQPARTHPAAPPLPETELAAPTLP